MWRFKVLFAWPEDWSKNYEKGERFVSMLRGAVNARKAVMVLKGDKRLPTPLNPVSQRTSEHGGGVPSILFFIGIASKSNSYGTGGNRNF